MRPFFKITFAAAVLSVAIYALSGSIRIKAACALAGMLLWGILLAFGLARWNASK